MEGCLKLLFEDHCYLISHVEKGVGSEVARFADNKKLFMGVSVREDHEEFQRHLIKEAVLTAEHHMQSFVDKYKVNPTAGNNLDCSYTLLGSKLTVSIQGEKKKTRGHCQQLSKNICSLHSRSQKANTTLWYRNNELENSTDHGII